MLAVFPAADADYCPARFHPGSGRRHKVCPVASSLSNRPRSALAGVSVSRIGCWYRAGRSRARLKIDLAAKILLALCIDLIEDREDIVSEPWRPEQDSRETRRRAGQPAVLGDIYDYTTPSSGRVTICGPSRSTTGMISLKRCLAS